MEQGCCDGDSAGGLAASWQQSRFPSSQQPVCQGGGSGLTQPPEPPRISQCRREGSGIISSTAPLPFGSILPPPRSASPLEHPWLLQPHLPTLQDLFNTRQSFPQVSHPVPHLPRVGTSKPPPPSTAHSAHPTQIRDVTLARVSPQDSGCTPTHGPGPVPTAGWGTTSPIYGVLPGRFSRREDRNTLT